MEYVNDLSLTYIPGLLDSELFADFDHQDIEQYKLDEFDDPKYFLVGISKRNIIFHDVTILKPSIDCWPVYFKKDEKGKDVLTTK